MEPKGWNKVGAIFHRLNGQCAMVGLLAGAKCYFEVFALLLFFGLDLLSPGWIFSHLLREPKTPRTPRLASAHFGNVGKPTGGICQSAISYVLAPRKLCTITSKL